MARNNKKEITLEEAVNGFIVRTRKETKIVPKKGASAGDVMFPDYKHENEEHVAANLADAMKIINDFLGAE